MEEKLDLLSLETNPENGDYLDTYAKVSNLSQNNDLQQQNLADNISKYLFWSGRVKEANRLTNCGQNWVLFSCSSGHSIYHKIACGLPYCPICSKPGSWYNKKRAKRVEDILLGFPQVGHFVFTLPKEISSRLPDSSQIEKLYKLAYKILKDQFEAKAAVIVLHFFGDKKQDLHLHFDCSFPILGQNNECGFPLITLQYARAAWTSGVNEIFKTDFTETVTHYNFVNTLEQEYHLIKYITRSTVAPDKFMGLDEKAREYVLLMNKKKIIRYFGGFVGKKKLEFLAKYRCSMVVRHPEKSLLEQHICPICNEKMKAQKPSFADDLPLINLIKHDEHTFIDRELDSFIRAQEAKRNKGDPRNFSSLLEYLRYQESELANDQRTQRDPLYMPPLV